MSHTDCLGQGRWVAIIDWLRPTERRICLDCHRIVIKQGPHQ